MGLHQIKELLQRKRNQQNKKATNCIGKDICKWYLHEEADIQNKQRPHTTQQQKQLNKKMGRGSGQVAQLVRALSQYTKAAGLIPGRAHTRINQWMNE